MINIHPLDFGALLDSAPDGATIPEVVRVKGDYFFNGAMYHLTTDVPVKSEYGKKIMELCKNHD